jgi:hypothetical protein
MIIHVGNDPSKMVVHYNSRKETEMSSTSDFRLRTSDMFVVEYWVTGKEADNNKIKNK